MIVGRPLVPSEAAGRLLVASEPLSFWGGYDQETGEIIDRRHPLSRQVAAQRVLALPGSRGSSTTTAVLLESIRAGKAPAGFVVTQPDAFISLASIVAEELYGRMVPVIQVSPEDFDQLRTGEEVLLHRDGSVEFKEAAA